MCGDTFWTPAARLEFAKACAEVARDCPSSADIVAFAERTLDAWRRPQIERHLGFCRHCAEEVIALEATVKDEANLEQGLVRRAVSIFDRWLPQGMAWPARAALSADSRTVESEEIAVGDVELSLRRQPDGHLLASLQRGDVPVAGAAVRLVYLREASGDEAGSSAAAASDEWEAVRMVDRITSHSGLADLGEVETLLPRAGEQRVEVCVELPKA